MLQVTGMRVLRATGVNSGKTLQCIRRTYRTTAILRQEDVSLSEDSKDKAAIELRNRLAARDYNNRRAAYKRQVSLLRREYAEEVAKQRAADKAEQEALERELTRRRLERQRRKNIRSAQNAMRQEQLRKQREKEFNEHLRLMQIRRDAKDERYAAARQLVIDELEQVAHLWLTTAEEVEAAFTHEAEQLLWARPGGILGEPNPTLDAQFWQYETHTWHMGRTYKSQREFLLEELEEMAYDEANIDKDFWTEERVGAQQRLDEKARLRAMVQSAGRTELLRKQKHMIEEQYTTSEGDVPKPVPAPSNRMLRNDRAQEREGVKLLMDNPTNFFVFDHSPTEQRLTADSDAVSKESAYSGPTLGAPVGLRDPLREKSDQNRVFPLFIGKIPKPDTRTEREKKQQERQERMWAAARAESRAEDMDIELAAQQQTAEDLEPDLNYDEHEWDSDEEEWKQGLDPEADKDILNTPREERYSEADIEWVLDQLDGKVKYLEKQFSQDMEGLKQSIKPGFQSEKETADPNNDLEAALLSLSDRELMSLSDLDETYKDMTPDEFSEAVKAINLTEEQIRFILDRDRTL